MFRSRKHLQKNKGFTLVELLVCITIFVIMTALLVVKYGNFNQNVLLTNLAYESALAIRTAQNYGLSVKGLRDEVGEPIVCNSVGSFQCAYGVAFSTNEPVSDEDFNNRKFILFADGGSTGGPNKRYDSFDQLINTYTLKSNATIISLCAAGSSDTCNSASTQDELYITFRRPDPKAIICDSGSCDYTYAKITIKASDGSMRSLSVRDNGQISVDI